MKTLFIIAGLLISTTAAFAYDEDTHFYATYNMARFTGIGHEVAMKLALGAQWMDESYISDPTSLTTLPITGIKKRRLLHFPSPRVGAADSERKLLGLTGEDSSLEEYMEKAAKFVGYTGDLKNIILRTETHEADPMATQLLAQGLKEGNLMKAAASLHVLEDSFAHAGTSAEAGHADLWHNPDRPFLNPEKYWRMTKTMMHALVAIRLQLPQEALDCQSKVGQSTGKPNCELDPGTLAKAYGEMPDVVQTVTHDTLKDPEYVRLAMQEFYELGTQKGYVIMDKKQYDAMVESTGIDGKKDAYQTLALFMDQAIELEKAGKPVLNLRKIVSELGRFDATNSYQSELLDYVDSYGDSTDKAGDHSDFSESVARDLLAWHIPRPLSDNHRKEFEDDGKIHDKEIEIRVRNIRALIKKHFNRDVVLLNNNTRSAKGFYLEMAKDKKAEPVIPKEPGIDYATFSLEEKYAWNMMILQYLYPTLTDDELHSVVIGFSKLDSPSIMQVDHAVRKKEIKESDATDREKRRQLIRADYEFDADGTITTAAKFAWEIKSFAKKYLTDLTTKNLVANKENNDYRNPARIKRAADNGEIKKFLGPNDTWLANYKFNRSCYIKPARNGDKLHIQLGSRVLVSEEFGNMSLEEAKKAVAKLIKQGECKQLLPSGPCTIAHVQKFDTFIISVGGISYTSFSTEAEARKEQEKLMHNSICTLPGRVPSPAGAYMENSPETKTDTKPASLPPAEEKQDPKQQAEDAVIN